MNPSFALVDFFVEKWPKRKAWKFKQNTFPFDCPALGWKMSSLGRSCKTSNVNFGTAGNLQNASESTLESIDFPVLVMDPPFDELGLYEETNPSYQGKGHPSKIQLSLAFFLASKLASSCDQTSTTWTRWKHRKHQDVLKSCNTFAGWFQATSRFKTKDPDPTSPAVLKNAFWRALPWRSIAFHLAWMADQTSRHTSRG